MASLVTLSFTTSNVPKLPFHIRAGTRSGHHPAMHAEIAGQIACVAQFLYSVPFANVRHELNGSLYCPVRYVPLSGSALIVC